MLPCHCLASRTVREQGCPQTLPAALQVALHVLTLAFIVVACTCGLLIPIMLWVFQMQSDGWHWYDAALFGSMIASTDAVAIVAVLKQGVPR